MKKILACVLAMVMMLSLAACGQKEEPAPAPAPAPEAGQEQAPEAPAKWTPKEDIEFVIPFGAGGGNDVMVRKMVEIIEKNDLCEVNVVPVNKSGGSGVVGYTYLTSKGAGYEYSVASTSASFYTQPLTGNSPFSPDDTNFSFVAHMVKDPVVLVANPKLGFENLDSIVEFAKANPGALKWGGVGNASDDAIIMYMLNDQADIEIVYVPYDDAGLMMTAVLGGHLDLCVCSLAEAEEHMKAGTMTPIAVCADTRMDSMADVPTMIEQGYDIAHQQSRGVVMNPGVAEEVLAYYSDLFQAVAETDEWKEFCNTNAMSMIFKPYDEFAEFAKEVKADYETYLALALANQ